MLRERHGNFRLRIGRELRQGELNALLAKTPLGGDRIRKGSATKLKIEPCVAERRIVAQVSIDKLEQLLAFGLVIDAGFELDADLARIVGLTGVLIEFQGIVLEARRVRVRSRLVDR